MDKVNVMSDREAFDKVYTQNFEKDGPTWEEDYQFALWAWDESLKWQASRQALSSCSEIPNSSDPESAVPEGFSSLAEATLAGCKCVLYGKENRHWPCPIHASCKRPNLGQRKAAQVGQVIGVLVQNQDGEVCAVTDLGRCTWLRQDVTGPGDGESVPDNDYIRALQDAFDIIQADANTEQNYGSLCRIGGVLAKLKAGQEKAQ